MDPGNLTSAASASSPAKTNQSDTTWMLVSTVLVFIMIPGLGFFYGGLAQRKNQLSLLISGAFAICIVSLQWFLFGYSLVFSETGSKAIGNFDNAILRNVGSQPNSIAPNLPSNVYMIYQNMFAIITPYIAFGGPAERATISSFLIFLVLWTTIVYDFIAYWTWGPNGWLKSLGVLDFAGGTPVHIASGFSALAYCLAVGPRKSVDFKKLQPSSVANVYLGTGLLWFGWFGFNGGSEGAINSRAVNAVIVSNLAAATAGMTWIFLEMILKRSKKMSLNGFCAGAVAGLVAITPASGYVTPLFSIVFGLTSACVCFFACQLKYVIKFKIDDVCDVFAIHGVGGIVGNLLTGVFAQNSVATMAGDAEIPGGVIDGNFYQMVAQLISIGVACPWAFVMTFLIVKLIHFMPGISLRLNENEEQIGADWIEIGEVAYDIQPEMLKDELNVSGNTENQKNAMQLANMRKASGRSKNSVEPINVSEANEKKGFGDEPVEQK